jgi:hypothetical protein
MALILIGPMLSEARQSLPLYQVQGRAEIDTMLYIVLCWFSLISCFLLAAFNLEN